MKLCCLVLSQKVTLSSVSSESGKGRMPHRVAYKQKEEEEGVSR